MKISIIIPAFNEEKTIIQCINSLAETSLCGLDKEIIVVDDCSTDNTINLISKNTIKTKVLKHEKNRGKGACIRTALEHCTGEIIVIQDADLEYIPSDLPRLLLPILSGDADVVYGSRFAGSECRRAQFFWHMIGNKVITLFSNMMTNLNLTDVEVGYKLFRKEIFDKITIQENKFGFEIEITAKIARLKYRIYEAGISYYGRTYAEGKKINWRDGVHALFCIIQYALIKHK